MASKRNMNARLLDELGPDDVLLGRGTGPNEHTGNGRFRNLVIDFLQSITLQHETSPAGNQLESGVKSELALKVVKAIKAKGGRFVKKVPPVKSYKKGQKQTRKNLYLEVPFSIALDKTKQTIRYTLGIQPGCAKFAEARTKAAKGNKNDDTNCEGNETDKKTGVTTIKKATRRKSLTESKGPYHDGGSQTQNNMAQNKCDLSSSSTAVMAEADTSSLPRHPNWSAMDQLRRELPEGTLLASFALQKQNLTRALLLHSLSSSAVPQLSRHPFLERTTRMDQLYAALLRHNNSSAGVVESDHLISSICGIPDHESAASYFGLPTTRGFNSFLQDPLRVPAGITATPTATLDDLLGTLSCSSVPTLRSIEAALGIQQQRHLNSLLPPARQDCPSSFGRLTWPSHH